MKTVFHSWFCTALLFVVLPLFLQAIETADGDPSQSGEAGSAELKSKAEKGDPEAQFYIGANYIDGIGVRKNIEEGLKWYRKSADQGYAEAQFNLGIMYESGLGVAANDAEAFKWYLKAAENGHATSPIIVAQMYQEGRGVTKNEDKAKEWFEKARQQEKSKGSIMDDTKDMPSSQPDQNAAEAQYQLGIKYLYGYGRGRPLEILKDEAEALKLIRQAANQGHLEAQAKLGQMYAIGRGVAKDQEEAAKWYRLAAEQGDAEAQYTLAGIYNEGKGVAKDQKEAAKWYRMAAEQGNMYAQCILGVIYEHGEGITKDLKEAVKWYRMAAEQGWDTPQFGLGVMYSNGRGVTKDLKEAVKWFRLAADQGYAKAQLNLGVMYDNGEGVAKDLKEAAKWYRMAAEQEQPLAQFNLGVMYANGEGVTKDEKEAVKWFRMAADQEHPLAQLNLGVMYANGEGVTKDDAVAYKWFLLASAKGNEAAKKATATIERRLTLSQRAEGQLMARDFKPRKALESGKQDSGEGIIKSRPEATGSGFFITDDGYFITNQHVIDQGEIVRVLTANGTIPAKVVKVDKSNDLALLKADGKFVSLPVAFSKSVRLGATVATVGFPNIGLQGFSPKLAKGEIASLAGIQDDARHFQISVPIQPGNSGGSLVDERGNVVGVVVAKLSQNAALATSGALAENVNYAVKSSYLLSFLESLPEVASKMKEPSTADRKFEDIVSEVEQATVLVLVY